MRKTIATNVTSTVSIKCHNKKEDINWVIFGSPFY